MAMRERVDSPLRPPEPDAGQPVAASAPTPPRLPLRALTGWEEEYVERHSTDANTARLCNEVLARCLVAPGEEPGEARQTVRELLVAERDRELVALRRLSLGPEVSARVPCPACGEISEADFSLDVLPLDFEPPPRRLTRRAAGCRRGACCACRPPATRRTCSTPAWRARPSGAAGCWRAASSATGAAPKASTSTSRAGCRCARGRRSSRRSRNALPELDLEMAVECSHCGAAIVAPFDVPVFFFSS